jgi:outer membrane protein
MPRPAIALLLALVCSAAQAEDLLQAYELSLRNDPKVAADRAAYEAALQAKPLARSLLLPQISAGAELSKNRDEILASSNPITPLGVARYDASGYRVSLSQTLFNWSQFAQLRQADAQLFAAEATLAAATQEQIIRVATRYFDVLAAEDSLRTAQAEQTAIASQLERARKRFEVGMSPILDVQETQARYDTTVAQEIEARRLLRSAREALRAVTGRLPETLAGLRESIPLQPPEPQDVESWVRTATQNNLQIQNAQALSDIARDEVQKQTGGHYPTLNLVGSYDYFDRLDSPFGGREQESGVLGLQLAIPLYAGGGVQAGVRQAAHTHEQRRAELELARREVERQTRDAYEGVVVGISRVEALAQALKSNRTALETTEAGYRVGARTVTDTLDAQSALYRAERDYARARYDYLLNTLRLKQSTGQLAPGDLQAVNALLAAPVRPQPSGVTPPAPGYPPGAVVAPEKPIKLEQPLPETPAPPATPPPAPAPAPANPGSAP